MGHVLQNFLAVPTVVPAGKHIDAVLQQVVRDLRRNPEAGGGVLAVGDHQIDLPLRHEIRQPVVHNLPPRRTHNVSNKKNAHELEVIASARM